jgi:hypothetical protein
MAWQRPINVTAEPIGAKRGSTVKDLQGWRISDLTVGYLDNEAALGKKLNVAVGLTNLTDTDVTLQFASSQKIRLEVRDSSGKVVYETPTDTSTPPTTQAIKATEGTYWTDAFPLDPSKFRAGASYILTGILEATNLRGSASVVLTVITG